ncbi:MAG TPA: D-Ala-D-Ala carboxypeptidase family metallohydrolase [Polyangiaceae bacterium]|nr:D-Ala-D-Ala carboxypeptidase family metallohydrolase [Polyangiaceae bacterium]
MSWSKAKRARAFASALAALTLGAGAASAQDGAAARGAGAASAQDGAAARGAEARPAAKSGPSRAKRRGGAPSRTAAKARGEGANASAREGGASPAAPAGRERGEAAAGGEGAPAVKERGGGATDGERVDGGSVAAKERGEGSAPAAKERGAAAPPASGGPSASAKGPGTTADAGARGASSRRGKTARRERAGDAPCLRDRVEVGRPTGEFDSFSLLRCDGKPAEGAVERLAILLRPYSAPKPALPAALPSGEARGREWAPGVRNADAGLLSRLQAVADHYRNKRIVIVSGYRPGSVGSYHKDARAVDVRVEGVRNEDLVAFCRGLRDTGCGYYPNSSFVHFDVRPGGTGHVYWIDASGPGEAPRYVSAWPPPRDEPLLERLPKPEEAAPRDEHTHPDVVGKKAGRGIGASDRSEETPPPGTGRGEDKEI